ncbi:FBP domain-containing protein [Bdellovibrio sp. NC01]|nr:FBP domain-containing protein [Bdellovibrio sp. NC01]
MPSQIRNFETENFYTIHSEKELIETFRPRDQKKLVLPERMEYPLNIRSYFTWKESSGVYTYLIFKGKNWDMPRGVAFKRTASTGEPVGGLCSWCNSYGTSEDIGLLSVAMSANVSTSYFICHDISCIEKIEDMADRGGKDPEKYITDLYTRMEKLFENISNYKREED